MQSRTHLTDFLFHHAALTPGKPAIIDGQLVLSWKDLADRVELAASYLAKQMPSSSQQQMVAILLPNTWEYVVAYLATLHLGHIALPVDVIYKPLEIEAVIQQIPPAVIIMDKPSQKRLPGLKVPTVLFDEMKSKTKLDKESLIRLPAEKQIASLLFTSGTTGKPKAAPYTHANHIWNITASSEIWDWTSNDTLLISLRLSHWHGLVMGLSGALYHGNTIFLQEKFDPEETLKALSSGKISMFTHVGLIYFYLFQHEAAKKYDLSKVRLFISASASLPPAVWQGMKDKYGIEILECYGSSEAGRVASNRLDDRRPGYVGKPLPGVKVRIKDNGEITVKTPGLFPGYYQNEEATNKALSADGWWSMGDLGELKDDRIILKGRVHERLKKFGYTIYPRDIEWALHQNPEITQSFVMGIQEESNPNDKLIFFIVTSLSEQEVEKFCKQNLPSIWRPDKVLFLDEMPRTRSGKPELAKLKEMIKL